MNPACQSALKFGSDSLLMKFERRLALVSQRNQHEAASPTSVGPAIAEAAARVQAPSFLIDGEAVIANDDGTPDFHALRSKRRGCEAVLYAVDLIEYDGGRSARPAA